MEVLSDILRTMRVNGSVYFCDHLDPPWTKTFTGMTSAGFHLIRRGGCWITSGDIVEHLGAGDLIFLSPGVDHELSSHGPDQALSEHVPRTLLLCGYCDFAGDSVTPLLKVFPRLTIIREEELVTHPWLKGTFDQISAEYMSQGPGSELVVNKLTEVVLVELIRINFGRETDNPFLLALNDKAISRALQLIHDNPQASWTLESLANRVAMSRAAFANRFKSLVGQPMFQYLTALRMQRAREMLQDTRLPVYEIASRTGYESDLAFTKTFKKHTGLTPKQYRARST